MKKIWKYIVGFFSFIGGILTLVLLSSNKNKKVKEIKKNIKNNEKKTKVIDKQIDASKETDEYLKRALENKKKHLEKLENNKKILKVDLKYYEGMPVIKEIKRVSKPGRRVYSRATSVPKIQNGLGLAILSTSKGVMSDSEARKNKIGGEIICRVF